MISTKTFSVFGCNCQIYGASNYGSDGGDWWGQLVVVGGEGRVVVVVVVVVVAVW